MLQYPTAVCLIVLKFPATVAGAVSE